MYRLRSINQSKLIAIPCNKYHWHVIFFRWAQSTQVSLVPKGGQTEPLLETRGKRWVEQLNMLFRNSNWKGKFRGFQKSSFSTLGGRMEIWTIRHGSWRSFEEERVEGEQKNKILNNEIAMQSITGISKWHKESLEAEKMWEQLCEVTLSY